MRRFLLAPLALLIALVALPAFSPTPLASPEAPLTAETAEAPEILALVFVADWCGACKVLDPKLTRARTSIDLDAVQFVMLDQTDAAARQQAAETAASGGYTSVYGEYEGKTGFVLLLDADSKTVLGRITSADTEAQMLAKVQDALARA